MEAHGHDLAAIEQYERARSFNEKLPGVSRRLAVLYERTDNREKASDEYAAAFLEDARDADLWNDLSHFQFTGGDFEGAETAARTALRINGEHKLAWVNLAVSLAEQKRYDDAHAAFSRAVGPAAAHSNLAIILTRHGETDLARRRLAEAQRLEPTLRQPRDVLATLGGNAHNDVATVIAAAKPNKRTPPAGRTE
jgi:tetratricopeptide (TPR) repeat protein